MSDDILQNNEHYVLVPQQNTYQWVYLTKYERVTQLVKSEDSRLESRNVALHKLSQLATTITLQIHVYTL